MPQEMKTLQQLCGYFLRSWIIFLIICVGLCVDIQNSYRESYDVSRFLLLRFVSGCYFFAYWSLFYQIEGLIGEYGLIPIKETSKKIQKFLKKEKVPVKRSKITDFLFLCTAKVFELDLLSKRGPSKHVFICMLVSLFGVIFPHFGILTFLYFNYSCFKRICEEFMNLQWDAFLLEIGFISIFYAMASNHVIITLCNFIVKLLLFRMMFGSGISKYFGRDSAWNVEFSAIEFFLFTQPLPLAPAKRIYSLPKVVLRALTALCLIVEIVFPLLSMLHWNTCIIFWIYACFHLFMMYIGKFGFSNVLAIGLGISLLDDSWIAFISQWVLVPSFNKWIATYYSYIKANAFENYHLFSFETLSLPLDGIVGVFCLVDAVVSFVALEHIYERLGLPTVIFSTLIQTISPDDSKFNSCDDGKTMIGNKGKGKKKSKASHGSSAIKSESVSKESIVETSSNNHHSNINNSNSGHSQPDKANKRNWSDQLEPSYEYDSSKETLFTWFRRSCCFLAYELYDRCLILHIGCRYVFFSSTIMRRRQEIIVEVSRSGKGNWEALTWAARPCNIGEVSSSMTNNSSSLLSKIFPRIHFPRLDWMIGVICCRSSPQYWPMWMWNLLIGILEGQKDILKLLHPRDNLFLFNTQFQLPDDALNATAHGYQYLRVRLFEYEFEMNAFTSNPSLSTSTTTASATTASTSSLLPASSKSGAKTSSTLSENITPNKPLKINPVEMEYDVEDELFQDNKNGLLGSSGSSRGSIKSPISSWNHQEKDTVYDQECPLFFRELPTKFWNCRYVRTVLGPSNLQRLYDLSDHLFLESNQLTDRAGMPSINSSSPLESMRQEIKIKLKT